MSFDQTPIEHGQMWEVYFESRKYLTLIVKVIDNEANSPEDFTLRGFAFNDCEVGNRTESQLQEVLHGDNDLGGLVTGTKCLGDFKDTLNEIVSSIQ